MKDKEAVPGHVDFCCESWMTLHQLLDKIGDLDEESILVFGFRQTNILIREVSRIFLF